MEKNRDRLSFSYDPDGDLEVMRQISDVYNQGFIDAIDSEAVDVELDS